ncbi:unnamed protein product [Nyctereutes procyonoides]|uniref:(raccoon dog) hypothetical protein n=1 Tax=Nyctereutes procyonoides TaxID=34880 RepID=A0A811YLA9_NYCPR|nr:unnamed protein product [Nyctereutes procyonoides]
MQRMFGCWQPSERDGWLEQPIFFINQPIMLRSINVHFLLPLSTAPVPEPDPEPPQELAPAPTVVPAAALEPKLQLERAVMPPAMSEPVQGVVIALTYCHQLEEPPAPLSAGTGSSPSYQGLSNHLPQWSNQP